MESEIDFVLKNAGKPLAMFGLGECTTLAEMRDKMAREYKRLAIAVHPDRNPDPRAHDAMQALNAAKITDFSQGWEHQFMFDYMWSEHLKRLEQNEPERFHDWFHGTDVTPEMHEKRMARCKEVFIEQKWLPHIRFLMRR